MDHFDYRDQDLGNIVFLEHLNLLSPDQQTANEFYIRGLGLTRDPYYFVGTDNMWLNCGRQQLHLPAGPAQRFRGEVILVTKGLESVMARLKVLEKRLKGTEFAWREEAEGLLAVCPWGNRFRLVSSWPGFRGSQGMPLLKLAVPPGSARAIAAFYAQVLGARVETLQDPAPAAKVTAGPGQALMFVETDDRIPPFDGHHICIYLPNMSQVHAWFQERGLVTRRENRYQFRFQALVDPDQGRTVYELEHEVRSLHHPLYLHPLVNRRGDEALP